MENTVLYTLTTKTEYVNALTKFRGNDDTRLAMKNIGVSEHGIVACDGHKLVLIRDKEYVSWNVPHGTYEILSVKKENKTISSVILKAVDMNYPDFARVIPAGSPQSDQIQIRLQKTPITLSKALVKLYQHTGNVYNYEDLEACCALSTGKYGVVLHAHKAEKDKMLLLEVKYTADGNTIITIIINPIQVD